MCMVISLTGFLKMVLRSVSNYVTPTEFSQWGKQILYIAGNCLNWKIDRDAKTFNIRKFATCPGHLMAGTGRYLDSSSESMVIFTQLKSHERSFFMLNSTGGGFVTNPNMLKIFMKYSSLLLILSAFFSNILNFVVNPGDSLAKIPRGISIITVLFTYMLIFSHQRCSNALERKNYFRQGPLIPLFANKLGTTLDVMTLNLNMLEGLQ